MIATQSRSCPRPDAPRSGLMHAPCYLPGVAPSPSLGRDGSLREGFKPSPGGWSRGPVTAPSFGWHRIRDGNRIALSRSLADGEWENGAQ